MQMRIQPRVCLIGLACIDVVDKGILYIRFFADDLQFVLEVIIDVSAVYLHVKRKLISQYLILPVAEHHGNGAA